jgi:hypothetical protein
MHLFSWLEKYKKEFEFESQLVASLIALYFYKCSRLCTIEYKEKSTLKMGDVTILPPNKNLILIFQ